MDRLCTQKSTHNLQSESTKSKLSISKVVCAVWRQFVPKTK